MYDILIEWLDKMSASVILVIESVICISTIRIKGGTFNKRPIAHSDHK